MILSVSAEADREPVKPNVTVLVPSPSECRNEKDNERKKTLVCLATGFYPDHVTVFWKVDGDEVKAGVATDSRAIRPQGEEFYKISSRLRVSAKDWFTEGKEFECIVRFFDGSSYENVTGTAYGEKCKFTRGLKNMSNLMFQLEITICSCSLLLSYNHRDEPEQR